MKTKKAVLLILLLSLFLSLLPLTALAEGSGASAEEVPAVLGLVGENDAEAVVECVDGTSTSYQTADQAMTNAPAHSTVRIMANVSNWEHLFPSSNIGDMILDLNGKQINGLILCPTGTTIHITGPGTVSNGGSEPMSIDRGGSIVVEGGNFYGPFNAQYSDGMVIKGGSFSSDPTAYVAQGYDVSYSTGIYTVTKGASASDPIPVVATIGDTPFTSLQAAFDALPASGDYPGYIQLQADYEVTEQTVVGGVGTLDLNGYNIYNNVDIYNYGAGSLSLISVQNGGTLNLIDSSGGCGAVYARPGDCYAVDARYGGVLTLNGGTYAGNAICVYCDGGDISIHNGYFYIQQTDSGTYANTIYRTDRYGAVRTTGGSYYRFNPDDKGFIPSGYQSYYNSYYDTWTVEPVEGAEGNDHVAAVLDAAGTGWSYYDSFDDAFANVPDGGTVQLLADCRTDAIDNGKTFKLSLAGYTLSFAPQLKIGENAAAHISIESGGGSLSGDTLSLYSDSTLSISDDDLTVDVHTYSYNDNVKQYSFSGGTYLYQFNKLLVADGYELVQQDDGTWKIKHLNTDADGDGRCDVCGAPLGDGYRPDVGTVIGVEFEDIGYNCHYKAYVGDGQTDYTEDIHEDYEAAIDYSHVRVDNPITVNNQTGRDLMSGKLGDQEALTVTLTTYDGQSFTTTKPPHQASDTDPTMINEIKTLMWEGLLTIESDNGYPAAGNGTLSIAIDYGYFGIYTLSFSSNGGTRVSPQYVYLGKTAQKPADPTRDRYYFVGWCEDAACTKRFDFTKPLKGNTVLYAKWAAPDLLLPDALTEIESEAFAGGAFGFPELSEKTVSIGPRAFADCPNLRYIYIPRSTQNIDPQAFGGSRELTVFGRTGSRAETYAEQHGFTFIAVG